MAQLPTLDVTPAQVQILLDTFGDAAGYKDWLKNAIVREVEKRRRQASRQAARTQIQTDLPDFVDDPIVEPEVPVEEPPVTP